MGESPLTTGDLTDELSEGTKVFSWRVECLLNAGYDFEAAWRIASSDSDLRRAVSLLEVGCDPGTALLILL